MPETGATQETITGDFELETTIGFPRSVTGAWRDAVQRGLEERHNLGVHVPDDFKVVIGLYQCDASAAALSMDRGRNVLVVNTIPALIGPHEPPGEMGKDVGGVVEYFNMAREAIPSIRESEIYEATGSGNPKEAFEAVYRRKHPGRRGMHVTGLREQLGVPIDRFLDYLAKNAGIVRGCAERLRNRVAEDCGSSANADVMRHELDHLALYEGMLYAKERELRKRAWQLQKEFHFEGKGDRGGELAAANMAMLEFVSGSRPLGETSAYVFSHVPEEGWNGFRDDPRDALKKALFSVFVGYINNFETEIGYPSTIADALISQKWAEGRMNRQTSNFIFQKTKGRIGRVSYRVTNPEEVYLDVAREIFFGELPAWQDRYMQNAERAADALGIAYAQDPSRLRRAYLEAGTFDNFLAVCKGG